MTDIPKVLVSHPRYPDAGLRLLKSKFEVIICEGIEREEIIRKCVGVDGILWVNCERLDAEILDSAGPQLKAIVTGTAGFDYVDLSEIEKRGIRFGYTPNVPNNAVADLAIGLMIAAARRFTEGYRQIVDQSWQLNDPSWMLGRDITNSTVGIVGFGRIGQVIARRLTGFDVAKIIYSGNSEKPEGEKLGATFVPFENLLVESDFIFIACPLTRQTKNLFNKDVFAKMKPTSVLINIARGGIIEQPDLIDALQSRSIFAAGLDVMDPEPLTKDHPLTKLANCVLTPHLGSAATRTRENMSLQSAQNLINGIEGIPMIY
ncbi:hypothetical protein HA402_016119 [Bradysia odoriphaga]|nr:hypothetical protein HA402_016119 [Bradysia odoriphaga]